MIESEQLKKTVVLGILLLAVVLFLIAAVVEIKKCEKKADDEFNENQRAGCRAARLRYSCPRECTKCSWNVRQHKRKRYMRSSGEMVNDTLNKKDFRVL